MPFLSISSKDRDPDQFPDPAEYDIRLTPPIKDVTEISLVHAAFPNVSYTVEQPNNVLTVNDVDVVIPPGVYGSTTLASTIETALRANIPGPMWKTRIHRPTMALVITTNIPIYVTSSIPTLRFPDPTSGRSSSLVVGGQDICMDIELLGNMTELDGTGGVVSFSAFTKIPLTKTPGGYVFPDLPNPINHVQNPSTTLSTLRIRFRTHGGAPVAFGGLDHSLLFRVKKK